MKDNCLDIGIIQAFLDGELSHDETSRVTAHVALCDKCALMLADAEEESAIVFPALEREFNTLVPTQRLWSKINDSIQLEKENRPVWQKAWAFLRFSLTSPSMVAAASLLLVFGVFGGLLLNKSRNSVDNTPPMAARQAAPVTPTAVTPASTLNVDEREVPVEAPEVSNNHSPVIERAIFRPEVKRTQRAAPAESAPAAAAYMPGEESYIKTIATLKRSVDEQKESVLRPSERVAFERNMAVVNDTIEKMRVEVKRNPKNEAAKQILYSSYQNKIDLLNSVSQKEELVASLQ